MSDVYVFFTDKIPGVTIGYPIFDENKKVIGVVSCDISLYKISEFLKKLNLSRHGFAFILNNHDRIIAHPRIKEFISMSQDKNSVKLKSVTHLDNSIEKEVLIKYKNFSNSRDMHKAVRFKVNDTAYLSYFYPFPENIRENWVFCIVVPENDFIGPLKRNLKLDILLTILILLIVILLASIFSNMISKPILAVVDEMNIIKSFDFPEAITPSSMIREIYQLQDGLKNMEIGLRSFEKYLPSGL